MRKTIASFVTLIACAMAAVAAWDRGGSFVDRVLLVSISVVIVLAVHLLPGLSKRRVKWLVWSACLLAAIYGHLTFLTYASQRAAQKRADESAVTQGTQKQIEAVKSALEAIQARSISIVANELYHAKKWRDVLRLREELAEAKRGEKLKLQLAGLYATSITARTTLKPDPVVGRVSEITGMSPAQISIIVGLIFSILVEVVGALLWADALNQSNGSSNGGNTSNVMSNVSNTTDDIRNLVPQNRVIPAIRISNVSVTDQITTVQAAIEAGECRKTVAAIRQFLACSQQRAMEIRRDLGQPSMAIN